VKLQEAVTKFGLSRKQVLEALDMSLNGFITHSDDCNPDELTALELASWAVKYSIPFARIFNRRYFWKDKFYVSPFVLDPRPETEALIEYVVANLKPTSILDLGTGTGCILLSLMREFPAVRGVGVDISPYALHTARLNAELLGIKADFVLSDYADSVEGSFDLIISNPPYVKGSVEYEAMFDPPISLYSENSYEKIINSKNLNPQGSIILEFPEYSKNIIENILKKNEMSLVQLDKIGNDLFRGRMELNRPSPRL
jgi:release factor glutamine methyltransferase